MLLLARRGNALSQLAIRSSASLYSTATTQSAVALHFNDYDASSSSQGRRAGLLALAAAGAAGYATSSVAFADAPAPAPDTDPKVVVDPYAKPTELHGLPKKIVLYQYEICPFCYKVKAFLDYHNIPYSTIEVNPLTKAELKWSTSYKKVPVVKLDDGEVVVDSSAIISRLAAEVEGLKQQQAAPAKPVTPKSVTSWLFGSSSSEKEAEAAAPAAGEETAEELERRWRKWVDAWLVKLVTANIYRTWRESWQTMTYISDQASWGYVTREGARTAGAVMMWQIGKRLPKKYNVEGDIRVALYTAVGDFLEAVGQKPFLGGAEPNLGDLAVFGVLRTVAGTDTFADVMANTDVAPWYDRMRKAVGPSARVVGGAEAAAAESA